MQPIGAPTWIDNNPNKDVNQWPDKTEPDAPTGEGDEGGRHYSYVTTKNNGQNNNYDANDDVVIRFYDDGTTGKWFYGADRQVEATELWDDGNGETGHHRIGYTA